MLRTSTETQFINYINQKKKVVFVGVGRRFNRIKNEWYGRVACDVEVVLADNSEEIIGSSIGCFGKSINVISVDELGISNNIESPILIIPRKYEELLYQISNNERLSKCDIVCYEHFDDCLNEGEALLKEIPAWDVKNDLRLIPKKIHYFWFGGNELPDKYKHNIETWRKFCPDYEIIQWNESNYDINKCKYMKQAYDMKYWGFVPDYARLDVIYDYGGFYFDTDVEMIKPLDDLLSFKAVAGFETYNNVNLGQGFGACSGLDIIKQMRDEYYNVDFVMEDGSPNISYPSPFYQTRVLERNGLLRNGEYQVINDELTVFPEKMFCGKSMATMRVKTTSYTHSIHHFDGTWADESDREYNRKKSNLFSCAYDL